MKPVVKKLSNGLPVVIVHIPSSQSATITAWVKTGSRFEDQKRLGISHFLEHMVFKGSQKWPTEAEFSEAVDSLGAEHNAGTSKEWTNFYLKARVGVAEDAFSLLSDAVINPLLPEAEIEKERGVILQEMAMYEDTPMAKVGDYFENIVFRGTSMEFDIIGTQESVTSITRSDFAAYRQRHYYAGNMLLTVAGGITEELALELAEEYFSDIKKADSSSNTASEEALIGKPQVLVKNKKTDQAHLVYGYLGFPRGHARRYEESLLATILGSGVSSRLWTEIRAKRGLAYAVHTSADHRIDMGTFDTYAGVSPEKAVEAVAIIDQEHKKIAAGGTIQKKELEKAKEYIKGKVALSLEDTRSINSFVGIEKLFLDNIRTPEEVYKSIDAVTIEQVEALAAELFDPTRMSLAVIGPYKDQKIFEDILR